MYRVYVVNFREGLVVDEEGPFDARDEAISAAEGYAARDRDDRVTGLGYEVVVPVRANLSQIVFWTAHSGDGVVDSGEGQPPWEE
jgi:hypothetical protein